ncbi:alpha/beta hydrolase [Streptomyces sp. NBC_00878]|uniref:alpha/beta hydrolase n=1 Tax=Streptomyces sp. NBC_00878 TaxID=2975854 RepID=UPI002257DB21|nr:alpha/beta fold hydrolase [Streptomyces sp. NBC_00878]MCX4904523.1 lysophospholipase [Streptomyces sp. NBC_00878]
MPEPTPLAPPSTASPSTTPASQNPPSTASTSTTSPSTTAVSTTVRAHDGLRLAGTLLTPRAEPEHAVLLLHGEGATREQDGFFTLLSGELAAEGVASLRFDLPGHGESEGRQEDLSLSLLLNVISSGLDHLREHVGATRLTLVATGLTGGVAAGYAARRGDEVSRLVLFNPLIDYKEHFVDARPTWSRDYLDESAGRELLATGRLPYTPSFVLGRALLNEVFWLQPQGVLDVIAAPTLIVHGAGPSAVSVESSRAADKALTCDHRLVELDAEQGGAWHAPAAEAAVAWILGEGVSP